MESARIVRDDHALLRKKLILLESALQVAPEARLVVREMCFSLQRVLQEHMQREHRHCDVGMPSHTAEHALLRGVNDFLLSGMKASVPMMVSRVSQVIEQLILTMHEQERFVSACFQQAQGGATLQTAEAISGTMSVNEILQRYPSTERVFERMHINRFQEGYESVDELAWRHGMNITDVVEELRQVASGFPTY